MRRREESLKGLREMERAQQRRLSQRQIESMQADLSMRRRQRRWATG